MKLLVVCSSLDLRSPYSSTPAWWQLLKALGERGVELIVAPYQGAPVETPWWTATENPCRLEGDTVRVAKRLARGRAVQSGRASTVSSGETGLDRLIRELARRVTRPRWRRHLSAILGRERDVDAVVFLAVPPNQLSGVPHIIRQQFGLPTYLYDGDVPASLPRFAGFQTGFKIYHGADLSEYEAVFSNSRGGVVDLLDLGARRVEVLDYAADPALWSRLDVAEQFDVFFYGHGAEYREEWIEAMLAQPSLEMEGIRFVVRGTHLPNVGRATRLPYVSFSKVREYCCQSRINLLITRRAHASVYGSSTARPFELAALGCAMVSNPYLGIEEWFEPGREVVLIKNAAEAREVYRWLLKEPSARLELGKKARERFLAEHTYAHRAERLVHWLRNSGSISRANAAPTRPEHAA